MQSNSYNNLALFVEAHLRSRAAEELVIVDFCSRDSEGAHRALFDAPDWRYVSVDVVDGPNVDIVLEDPDRWGEIKSNTADVLVSGQAFTHLDFFWIAAREMVRILKPGGLCCLVTPIGGAGRCSPSERWQVYPDGLRALARYAGLEVLSVIPVADAVGGANAAMQQASAVLIAQKPLCPVSAQAVPDPLPPARNAAPEHIYEGSFDPKVDSALGKIARLITPGTRVLELGPATGYFTDYLARTLNCTVDCVEQSQKMADRARVFSRKMVVTDLNETRLEDHFDIEAYDYVVAADVLEHLQNPVAVLKSCRKVLKPQGQLLLSVPNIAHAAVVGSLLRGEFNYTEEGLLDRTHTFFFTRRSLLEALSEAELGVTHLDAIVKLPEETEICDDFLDLPAVVQEALYALPDSTAYQYVVAATPDGLQSSQQLALDSVSRATFSERRQSFSRQLTEKNSLLEEGLAHAQAIVVELRDELAKQAAQTSTLTAAFEHAQRLAIERMAEVDFLNKALREAQGYVSDQVAENDRLSQQLNEAQSYVADKVAENERLSQKLSEAQGYVADKVAENERLSQRLTAVESKKLYRLLKRLKFF